MKKICSIFMTAFMAISAYIPNTKADLKSDFTKAENWTLALENIDIEKLANSDFDIIVIDYSYDGTGEKLITKEDIKELHEEGKIVLAYMSIGTAQQYRFYWRDEWNAEDNNESCFERYYDYQKRKFTYKNTCDPYGKPRILGSKIDTNPGGYQIKYWYPVWWSLAIEPYLEKINKIGFDGVYLDNIDAYQYWAKNGFNKRSSADRMVNLLSSIKGYAQKNIKREFLIVTNGGLNIVNDAGAKFGKKFLGIIDGVSVENLFFNSTAANTLRNLRLLENKYFEKVILNKENVTEKEKEGYLSMLRKIKFKIIPSEEIIIIN